MKAQELQKLANEFRAAIIDRLRDAAKADGRWAAAYAPIRSTSAASMPADLVKAINANPRAKKKFRTLKRMNLFARSPRSAETVAPAAPNMRMGVFYVYGAPAYPVGGVINTPRGCRLAAAPTVATAAADLRGVVGRVVNQTTLASDFNDGSTFDQYKAGQIAFGLLRGEVDVVVDPASGTFSALTEAVYVVIAPAPTP